MNVQFFVLRTIKDLFLERIAARTLLLTDKARAYFSFMIDYPDLEMLHLVVNHKRADRNGFNWILVLGPKDGEEYAEGRRVDVTFTFSLSIFLVISSPRKSRLSTSTEVMLMKILK